MDKDIQDSLNRLDEKLEALKLHKTLLILLCAVFIGLSAYLLCILLILHQGDFSLSTVTRNP